LLHKKNVIVGFYQGIPFFVIQKYNIKSVSLQNAGVNFK